MQKTIQIEVRAYERNLDDDVHACPAHDYRHTFPVVRVYERI